MKIKKFVYLLSAITLLTSCSEAIDEPKDINTSPTTQENLVTLTKDGYLSFSTYKSLESFFTEIQNGDTPDVLLNSRSDNSFVSLAMLNDRIDNKRNSRSEKSDDDSDDLEEMTQEEFDLMKAEELLFDNLMTHALDTTLRICVEGELYKITPHGTFSVKLEKAEKLDMTIKQFNPQIINSIDAGKTIQLSSDVKFTNTFKSVQNKECDLELEEEIPTTRSISPIAKNEFHKNYSVNSYSWKSRSVIDNILDYLRGKDVSRSKNFSKNRRVQVNVFDVNYKFYKSAGIKVKMQKRKKFLGIPYWVGVNAEKLAIGFNEMEGELKYNNPNNLSTIQPTASAKWEAFKGTLNGVTSSFIYGAYYKLKFLKDWTDWAFGWMPEIKIGDKNYTDQIINKIYNTPAEYVYGQSKKLINKKVYAPIEKRIKPEDPMVAYLYWGVSAYEFNKERPFISGVKEYVSCKSKSVIFDRSFGIAFLGAIPVPYTPSDFNIKYIDAFGAAYYDNKWMGIRFYGK